MPDGASTRLRRHLAALPTRRLRIPADRFEAGMAAQRSLAMAAALAAFVAGFSLDDLRVLRAPAYLAGIAAALLLVAFGPLWMGRSFAAQRRDLDAGAFAAAAAQRRRLGSLTLLATAVLGLAWLAVFSSGVPPWAS